MRPCQAVVFGAVESRVRAHEGQGDTGAVGVVVYYWSSGDHRPRRTGGIRANHPPCTVRIFYTVSARRGAFLPAIVLVEIAARSITTGKAVCLTFNRFTNGSFIGGGESISGFRQNCEMWPKIASCQGVMWA